MSTADAQTAIDKLCGPDPYSRTTDHDGRRVMAVDGGWKVLNYLKYRERRDPEKRRQQNREAQRRFRDKHRKPSISQSKPTISLSQKSEDRIQKSEEEHPPTDPPRGTASKKAVEKDFAKEFEAEFWPNVPTKVSKQPALKAYIKARHKVDKDTIFAGLPFYREREAKRSMDGDYRPLHPSTWLNQERWTDEPPKTSGACAIDAALAGWHAKEEAKAKENLGAALRLWPGQKRHLDTEFEAFQKERPDWQEILEDEGLADCVRAMINKKVYDGRWPMFETLVKKKLWQTVSEEG
jgi:hypothetical protein